MYFQGCFALVVLALKMAAKTGVYVQVAEAVCPSAMVTVWLGGVVQPCTLLKATVCGPALRFGTTAPLGYQVVPPSKFHLALELTAPGELIVTVRDLASLFVKTAIALIAG
jgi:hypothetical protein